MAADPEVDEAKEEQVVGNEMGCNVAGRSKVDLGSGLVEGEEVVELEKEDNDPVDAREY